MTNGEDQAKNEAPQEAVELFNNYVKGELEAAEDLEELATKYSVGEIEAASMVVYGRLIERVEDVNRLKTLYVILGKVGEVIGSEPMLEESKKKLTELTEPEEK